MKTVIFALAVYVLGTIAVVHVAKGHDHGPGSWINRQRLVDPVTKRQCCNKDDCQPLAREDIREVAGGYLIVPRGETIPHERVIQKSEDGRFWRCEQRWNMEGGEHPAKIGDTRCLIAPPFGS